MDIYVTYKNIFIFSPTYLFSHPSSRSIKETNIRSSLVHTRRYMSYYVHLYNNKYSNCTGFFLTWNKITKQNVIRRVKIVFFEFLTKKKQKLNNNISIYFEYFTFSWSRVSARVWFNQDI